MKKRNKSFDVGQEAAQGVSSTSTLVNPLENYKRQFPLAADGRSHTMSTTNGTQNTGNRAGLIVVGGVLVVVAAATALVLLL
jgi:hypothetical protein